ncbi:MAG: hypothetical protein HKO59_04825 [Phycisphaerales bacterium]|nr:hypothetical protein [Phycisphaerales bacterium]NNM25300.1 hypothetical protein [Phycisphaerales bacterium]
MNSPFVRWLLDLERIPANADDLRLVWEHPLPAWLVVFLVMMLAALAAWSYSRLAGGRLTRGLLAGARFVVLLLALTLLLGPVLELPRETVEPDWVMILADRSASMTIADAPGRVTRNEQLEELVRVNTPTFDRLAADRQVRWLGFHAGAFNLDAATAPPDSSRVDVTTPLDFGPPDGQRTNLAAALGQALQRAAARPVSGLVVLSDGRTADPPDRAVLRRLQAEAIPVFVVPLGSPEAVGDLALRRVDVPRRAFVRDKVPVVVEVDHFGGETALGGAVVLVDDATGAELDRVELPEGGETDRVTLTAEPALAGETQWRVVIETGAPDLIPENNIKPILIELVDRPLRVLYVEGYPRWEYRYLKNLLVREKSIESSVMLLSADRDFAQEGNQPITRLPRSPEELARYDVVILGDVPAGFFNADQLDMMRNHVADRGAGLLWIGGERSTPSSYAGSTLADLLPMGGSLKLPAIGHGVTIKPTELAERLGVLRLVTADGAGWPASLLDPSYGWSSLYYTQRINPARLKATAEVLAETVQPVDGAPSPVVAHIRYGAGQSIYVATDEIWRWRYGQGELLPDQFWIQMIRMLGRESLTTAGARAVLDVRPRRLEINQPMRVDLQLLDAQLTEDRRASVAAVLETEDGQTLADLELRRVPGSGHRFAATYLPEVSGSLQVRLSDPTLGSLALRAPVEVYAPDDELRRPQTDHGTLAHLAAATGGRVLAPDELAALPELLPNRSVRTINPLRERIWNTPLAFMLVLLALTAEWVGRKVVRLM